MKIKGENQYRYIDLSNGSQPSRLLWNSNQINEIGGGGPGSVLVVQNRRGYSFR